MPKANVGGVSLYVEEAGQGTPLIFVHEFAGDCWSWQSQVRFFSRRYRTIVFNARGYPPSDVPLDPKAYYNAYEVNKGMAIAGDTLFAGSIGRTDLPGGSFDKIIRSLHGKLLALPDETVVVPGHGQLTSIGEERQSNPFLKT